MSKIEQYQELLSPNMDYSQHEITFLSKQVLPDKRYRHVLRVLETALKFADQFEIVDRDKIIQAVLFHDFAKGMTSDELNQYASIYDIDLEGIPPPVYHGIVGAWMAEHFFNINDKEIIEAIYYHTTGYTHFLTNEVGAILFLADFIEPGRRYNVAYIKKFVPRDLRMALREVVKEKIRFTIYRNRVVDQESLLFYHALLS